MKAIVKDVKHLEHLKISDEILDAEKACDILSAVDFTTVEDMTRAVVSVTDYITEAKKKYSSLYKRAYLILAADGKTPDQIKTLLEDFDPVLDIPT